MLKYLLVAVSLLVSSFGVCHAADFSLQKGMTRSESARVFSDNENYAVIVGINQYDHIGHLNYAVEDARRLAAFFESQGYQVELLTDYAASRKRILQRLQTVAEIVANPGGESGNVVFAFSGHGFRNNKTNYLATPETDPDSLATTALALTDVSHILEQAQVRQRVLFIDACRNDPGRSIANDNSSFVSDDDAEGLAILYSTRAEKKSWEDTTLQQGVFSYYLVKGLQGEAVAKDGLVTFDNLHRYVSKKVKKHVLNRFKKVQIPYIGGERTGEFVLAKINSIDNTTQPATQPSLIPPPSKIRSGVIASQNKTSLEPEMVALAGGTFTMGSGSGGKSAKPAHEVTVTPFWIATTEVTFAQFDEFSRLNNLALATDQGWGRNNRPVINISWQEVQKYVHWLKQQTGKSYRLPSEAEWEFAARANTSTDYYWGSRSELKKANCRSCNANDPKSTLPVKSFPPNPWSLYDMLGNVWEWTADHYHGNYQQAPADSRARTDGKADSRVVRGGSWYNRPNQLKVHTREKDLYYNKGDSIGFRLARDLTKEEKF